MYFRELEISEKVISKRMLKADYEDANGVDLITCLREYTIGQAHSQIMNIVSAVDFSVVAYV